MTAVQSEPNKRQNELLGAFLKAWSILGDNTQAAARTYKACVDEGLDMSRYVSSKSLATKLLLLAEDRLIPLPKAELLLLPAPVLEAMAKLPKDIQTRVYENGASVMRDGKVQQVPFHDIKASEAVRLVDTTGGVSRLVSPKEQVFRALPPRPKHDKLLQIRLSAEELEAIIQTSSKERKSPQSLIRDVLKDKGII